MKQSKAIYVPWKSRTIRFQVVAIWRRKYQLF